MLKIGFYLKEVNLRGVCNSVYLYATNNQKILKNKSFIFYNKNSSKNENEAMKNFKKKFKFIGVKNKDQLNKFVKQLKIDYCYFQREGFKDYLLPNTKNIIHAIFPENSKYHGHRYAFVSKWLSKNCSNNKYSFVPLPIRLPKNNQDLRKILKIPKNAKVFGYHGGATSFDLKFVKDAIKKILNENKNIYFLFMNIDQFIFHKRVIFIKGSFDELKKVKFINTCDAMLHARSLGESFGISCAEFAIKNRIIFTYGFCKHRAHFEVCRNYIIPYFSINDLISKLKNFKKEKRIRSNILQKKFSEKNTIKLFKEVFLNKQNKKKSLKIYDYIFIFCLYLKRIYFYARHKIYTKFYVLISSTLEY